MIISNEIKQKIQEEYDNWVNIQYGSKTKEERQKLGQFFTPPELSIQMLEKYEDLSGNILDPTVGCGGLLAAAVIAGANPRNCFGIELDPETAVLCRDRLAKLGVPRTNIQIGDALVDDSYNFKLAPDTLIYFKVENVGIGQVKIFVDRNSNGKVIQREFIVNYAKNDSTIKHKFETLLKLFELVNGKNIVLCSDSNKYEGRLKFMNAFFKKYCKKTVQIKNPILL